MDLSSAGQEAVLLLLNRVQKDTRISASIIMSVMKNLAASYGQPWNERNHNKSYQDALELAQVKGGKTLTLEDALTVLKSYD